MTDLKAIYLNAYKKYNVGNEQLLINLGDDLFKSPATTTTSLHNAFEGGLVDHLIRIAKFAVKINSLLPANMVVNSESLMRVALLSEIGKVGTFKPNPSDWHRNNLGKMYEYVEDKVSLRVGQRSIYQINAAGIQLTEAEYQAILNHDSSPDDQMIKWHSEMLTVILKQAIELAIIEEKKITS